VIIVHLIKEKKWNNLISIIGLTYLFSKLNSTKLNF
jgi:hypothetical protein